MGFIVHFEWNLFFFSRKMLGLAVGLVMDIVRGTQGGVRRVSAQGIMQRPRPIYSIATPLVHSS